MKSRSAELKEILDYYASKMAEVDADPTLETPELKEELGAKLAEAKAIQIAIKANGEWEELKKFLTEPVTVAKAEAVHGTGTGTIGEAKTLGDQVIEQFVKGGSQLGVSQA